MSITVALSHDKEALDTLRDEWVDLQTRSSATGISIAWQWIHLWYKYFNHHGELWLMTAREGNRLIGIAPLIKVEEQYSRGVVWQQIEFIGTVDGHEYLDFIIETGYEEQVITLFIDTLYEHKPRWDVILLSGMWQTKTINILQQSGRQWVEHPEKNMQVPYRTLPNTVDEWMQSYSGSSRQKLRRERKKLDEQFPDRWSIKQVNRPDELDETFDHLVRINQERWEAVGQSGSFNNDKMRDYVREWMHILLDNGWLRLYHLDIDDKPYAVDFSCHYLGRAYAVISGILRIDSNIALGIVLMQHNIEQAIIEGCREFSFGEGKEPYKYRFGGVKQVHKAFRLIGSPRVRLQIQSVSVLRGIKSRMREVKTNVSVDEVDKG